MQFNYRNTTIGCLFAGLMLLISCTKLLEADPPASELTGAQVFSDSAGALGALVHIYSRFGITAGTIENYFAALSAMYADEVQPVNASEDDLAYYNNRITVNNAVNAGQWQSLYSVIYECNALLEGLQHNTTLAPAVIAQYSGEAAFLRAYAYFLLVNCYGAVPLVLTTPVQQTALLPRSPTAEVYSQIVLDLQEAIGKLGENYPVQEKVRVNKWAAAALLAKVQLYLANWQDAENNATLVLNSAMYTPLEDPAKVFLANSRETILQFYEKYGYTWSGNTFQPFFGSLYYTLSPSLLAVFSNNDLRKQEWITGLNDAGIMYHYPVKYHNSAFVTAGPAEYTMCLRAGEQYLIRAEARCRQGNITGAVGDINTLHARAGIESVSPLITADSCLQLVAVERQRELFTEWGNRFFDLKRTGTINKILGAAKPTWQPAASLYPIPASELSYNAHLTQNPGY